MLESPSRGTIKNDSAVRKPKRKSKRVMNVKNQPTPPGGAPDRPSKSALCWPRRAAKVAALSTTITLTYFPVARAADASPQDIARADTYLYYGLKACTDKDYDYCYYLASKSLDHRPGDEAATKLLRIAGRRGGSWKEESRSPPMELRNPGFQKRMLTVGLHTWGSPGSVGQSGIDVTAGLRLRFFGLKRPFFGLRGGVAFAHAPSSFSVSEEDRSEFESDNPGSELDTKRPRSALVGFAGSIYSGWSFKVSEISAVEWYIPRFSVRIMNATKDHEFMGEMRRSDIGMVSITTAVGYQYGRVNVFADVGGGWHGGLEKGALILGLGSSLSFGYGRSIKEKKKGRGVRG